MPKVPRDRWAAGAAREILRAPRLADRAAIAALAGEEAAAAAFLPTVAARVLAGPDGQVRGFVAVWGEPPYARLGCLHALGERASRSAGPRLMGWAERRARELAARAPAGSAVVLVSAVGAPDDAARARLAAAGFGVAGRILRMEGMLPLHVARAELPTDFDIVPLEAVGWAALYDAWREAFACDPTHVARSFENGLKKWQADISGAPGYDPAMCIGLRAPGENGRAVAVAVAYERSPNGEPVGWVEWVAVRPQWRSRGLARTLLAELSDRLQARGLKRVALTVDSASNPAALVLYERAGLRATAERISFEKPIR